MTTQDRQGNKPKYVGIPLLEKYYLSYRTKFVVRMNVEKAANDALHIAESEQKEQEIKRDYITKLCVLQLAKAGKIPAKAECIDGRIISPSTTPYGLLALMTGELPDDNQGYGAIMQIFSPPSYGWWGRDGYTLILKDNIQDLIYGEGGIDECLNMTSFDNHILYIGAVVAEGPFGVDKKRKKRR